MKELVVIVPDSHLIESMMALESHDLRLPGLARVARFASAQPLSLSWRAWLAAWLGMDDSSVPPAAIAALALPDEDATPEGAVWFAQPVHWVASLTTLHLPAHGLLRLASAEQQLLVESFAASFASAGFRLRALPSGGFLALGTALPDGIETLDPAQCLGANLAEALPQGPGAAALRRLGAEIEMWLHEHPVNITRMRAGQPPISTLWLWGGGARLATSARAGAGTSQGAADERTVLSEDAYMRGLALLSGRQARAPVPSFTELAPDESRVLVPIDLAQGAAHPARTLERLDEAWIVPALRALDQGALARLLLVTGRQQLTLGAHSRLKIWRRPRAPLAVLA